MKTKLLGATALLSTLIVVPAFAQDASTPSTASTQTVDPANQDANPNADPELQQAQEAGEVVVTGSRLRRPNLDTAVPVISVSAAQLNSVGQTALGDTLNRLPALRSTFSQANSTNNIGTAGISQLDLRGLGAARTLVLVNGRRHVSGQPGNFAVDVNSIPNDLIERIEVVTGGNSGTYGSDAVSGVVNFVLKQDYEGLEARIQGGVSSRNDRGSYLVNGIWGKNFSEGRGNVTIAAEYAYQDQLLFQDRPTQTGAYSGVPGFYQVERTTFLNPDGTARNEPPEGNGVPDTAFFNSRLGSTFGIISLGGTVITSCPNPTATNAARRAAVCTGQQSPTGGNLNNNYVFLPDGTLVRDIPGLDLRPVGGGTLGGQTATGVEGAMLLPGLDRVNVNLLAHYDFSDAFRPFIEAKYVHITANQTSTQPSFINGRLLPTFFLDNPYLTAQARQQIQLITGTTSSTAPFTFFRFNNDIGTRAEDHERDTYRFVVGTRGDLGGAGNWRYEASFNYGRTETYYETGGNVDVLKFNRAADAVRNTAGQIVCRVNADASTTNDDPACRPINFFGERAPLTTPDGLAYVLYTSSREQWHEQLNALYFLSGDSSGMFTLPGGPAQIALGLEFRSEDFFSAFDEFTKGSYLPGQSNTFLNAIQDSNPKAAKTYEAFGELRLPILRNMPFANELSLEGSGRASKYSFLSKPVYAYTVGAVYSPVPDIRFRVGFARSVRAPNLGDLYAGASQTFANNFVDPCSQTVIAQNPNRARNCAAAGIPTTITLPDGSVRPWTNAPTSGILGENAGNPLLEPEKSDSFTVGAVFQPRFLPGVTLTVDYYNIRIKDAINAISAQEIVNNCYDDPSGIDNQFCALINRRRTPGDQIADYTFLGQQGRRFAGFPDFNVGIIGNGFSNQPFNYAKLETSGIDADLTYTHEFGPDVKLNVRAVASWLRKRNQFTFLNNPEQYTRVKSTLGDPEWRGLLSANMSAGPIDISLTSQYTGKQVLGTWNTLNREQDRPPTNADQFPIRNYPAVFVHDIQVGFRVNDKYRFYVGVDNVNDQLPPYGLNGTNVTPDGRTSAIYSVIGRYFYAGARAKF